MILGWHVELDQRYVKSLMDAKSMATPGSRGQESSHVETCDRTNLRHCFQCEENHDRSSRTDHSLKEEIEQNRTLPQKMSAVCTELPWVEKLDDDADWAGDPKTRCSTSGGVLAVGPSFTVRQWSVSQATVSLSSAESEAKAITKGCIEALYVKYLLEHQTARPFKIELWTDKSSAKAIMQRLGPGRRAKHLEVQTMWVNSWENSVSSR